MRIRYILTILTALLAQGLSYAQEHPVIGVVAPYSGQLSILGKQVGSGALAAASDLGLDVTTVSDTCDAAGGQIVANKLVEAKASVAIGFLCTESLEAALPILKEHNIVAVTIGARTNSLTYDHDKTGWPLLRLAPHTDAEAAAAVRILLARWREAPFAIVDDGTIGGRELAEGLRLGADLAQLKPVFVDTYRPDEPNQVALAGRLRRAGAAHVFVGGNRQDLAILARDAAGLGAPLTLAGGENLRNDESDPALPKGALMIGLADPRTIADANVVQALEGRGMTVEGYVLPAYAAVQIAAAAQRLPAGERFKGMVGQRFDTLLGQISFDDKGDLADNPYGLYVWDGAAFSPAEQSQ